MITNAPAFQALVGFLSLLPQFEFPRDRRSLVSYAGLGILEGQIDFEGPPKTFITHLLRTLVMYGSLPDGRKALDAVLDAVAENLGGDRQVELSKLRKSLDIPVNKPNLYSGKDILEYLEFIERQCATVDPRGMRRGSKTQDVVLPLEDVFITLSVGQNNPFEREAEQNLLDLDVIELIHNLHLFDLSDSPNELDFRYRKLAEEFLMLSERMLSERAYIFDLHTVLRQHRWIVILGDPGSGKTTLLQWLCLQAARALLADQERVIVAPELLGVDSVGTQIDLGPTRFPILIRIADYAKARREKGAHPIIDFVRRQPIFGQRPMISEDKLISLCLSFLKQGNALVLLDGLDEITNPVDRREIRDEIEEFVAQYIKDPINEAAFIPWAMSVHPSKSGQSWWRSEISAPVQTGGNQVIITSRKAGYRAAVLRGEFAHYSIEQLADDSIRRFCRKWTLAIERYLARQSSLSDPLIEDRAAKEAEALIDNILENKGVRKLATNPLLLTMLALLHREQSRLPAQRIRLYEQAVQTLVERRAVDIDEAQVVDVLGPLALWLHETQPTGLATETELRDQIGAALARWLGVESGQPLPGKYKREIDAFITSAREQSGLLVARGEGLYGFLHLTFQEYFVAREITRDSYIIIDKVLKYLHRPRWQEPLLLAIAYLSNTQRGGLEPIMRAMLDARSEHEDILHRDLLFTAMCIAESIWTPPSIVRRVVSDLLMIYADETGSGRFKALRGQIITTLEQIYRSDTAEIIEDILIKALLGSDAHLRSAAAAVITDVPWGSVKLLSALLKALSLPGLPKAVSVGFNALLQRVDSAEKLLPPYTLETVIGLYGKDPKLADAINFLLDASPTARVFLGRWARLSDAYIVPLLIRTLKLYEHVNKDQFASLFVTELQYAFRTLASNSAGAVYISAINAIASLDSPTAAVEIIQNDIRQGTNIVEAAYLFLVDFPLELSFPSFLSRWDALLSNTKQQFFDVACQCDRCSLLEDFAWQTLREADLALHISALKLLQQLTVVTLTSERLNILEPFFIDQTAPLAHLVESIIAQATLPTIELMSKLTVEKLRTWLNVEDNTHRIFASYLLAKHPGVQIDSAVYTGLTQALRSENDLWRQLAASVLELPRLVSQITLDVIHQAATAQYEEEFERRDGWACLAHQSFIQQALCDDSTYITRWADELSQATDEREKSIRELKLGIVFTRDAIDTLIHVLEGSISQPVQERIVESLNTLLRIGCVVSIPTEAIAPLLDIVKKAADVELRLSAARMLGFLALTQPPAYAELIMLCSSDVNELCIAGIYGLGTLALYLNQDQSPWEPIINEYTWTSTRNTVQRNRISPVEQSQIHREIGQHLKQLIESREPQIRFAGLAAYTRILLVSATTPDEVLDQITKLTITDSRLLRVLFLTGEGDDHWDEIICECGQGFHSKLVEVARLCVTKSSLLLAEMVKYLLEMLALPERQWEKKRVPLATLAACAQELPASLALLENAKRLQDRLLEAATDANSFSVRRFALMTLGQFRTVSQAIIQSVANGCRDLTIVRKATFQAIGALRRIELDALPYLTNMLSSSSDATVYAATMVLKEIGSSRQAVEEPSLRTAIVNDLALTIHSVTLPRYIYIDDRRLELLDDAIFTAILQILSDYPEEIAVEEIIDESRLGEAGLRERSTRSLFRNLDRLKDAALEMQTSLQAEEVEFVRPGIRLVLRGDQQLQSLELDGIQQADLVDTINNAIKQSQEVAAKLLVESSSEEDLPIGFSDLQQGDLVAMQRRAQQMQQALRAKMFEVTTPQLKLVMTGDQVFTAVELDGVQREELRVALNEAISRTQRLAAEKLMAQSTVSLQEVEVPTELVWIRAEQEAAIRFGTDPVRLVNLAHNYLQHGELVQAHAALDRAALVSTSIRDHSLKSFPRSLGAAYHNLGRVYERQEQYPPALVAYQQAAQLWQPLADPQVYGVLLHDIGDVYRAQGDLEQAVVYYQQAAEYKAQANDPHDRAFTLRILGQLLADLKRYAEAFAIFEEAREIYEALTMPQQVGEVLHDIAEIYRAQGDLEQAAGYDQQATEHKAKEAPSEKPETLFVNLSIPYIEGSIERVDYNIHDNYFHLIFTPRDRGIAINKKHVIVTRGTNLPILSQDQLSQFKLESNLPEFTISFPYVEGSVEKVSYNINDNYFHLTIEGREGFTFDKRRWRFNKKITKTA